MARTDIVNFSFHGASVRVVVIDGEPWLVGRDVSERLGYTNPQKAVRDHCKHGRPVGVNGSFILDPQTVIIPESDVYRLVMRSHMKQAEEFEEWVTRDVLPSIRKNGMYATDELLDDPEHLLKVTAKLVEERRARLVAEQQVKELAPKGEFFDHVADATNLQGIARVAKMLDTGEIRFFRWLRAEDILMSNNVPYQRFLDEGYFKIKQRTFDKPNGDQQTATTTYVTGKGITWLQKRWAQAKQVTA